MYDWMESVYGSPTEEIPDDAPVAKGNLVQTSTYVDANLMHDLVTVEKLQFSLFSISCSQGILNASWLSWSLVLKIACLHVSFTAYENFYKLSKMHCLLVLTFHFPIFRMSECRNPTIKHIFTYTLISTFRSTYVTDLFLVILFT